MLLLSLLAACTAGTAGDTAAADDTAGGGGTTDTNHPIAPDAYEALWDLDAAGCDDADAIAYWVFTGDVDGRIVLAAERVDDENLLHVELTSEDDVIATGTVVVTEALEGGCSDWTFEGELEDDLGGDAAFEGVLTTTTGEGTWTLSDGRSGIWAWGSR